ncbi:hypothetical protein MRX96_030053 [Rhipicephalus microplus]
MASAGSSSSLCSRSGIRCSVTAASRSDEARVDQRAHRLASSGGHPVVTPVPLLATAALLLGSTTTGSSDCYDVITAHHVTLRDTRKRVAMACGRLLTDLEGHKAGVKTYTRAPLRATQTPADSR